MVSLYGSDSTHDVGVAFALSMFQKSLVLQHIAALFCKGRAGLGVLGVRRAKFAEHQLILIL